MAGRTIVVVEDEETIAGAVAARLRADGFRVETAGDGPGGVELCARVAPDLVVLDLMLPGFDGIEACRRIQAERPVAVLMLTARDTETDVLVGLGVGADDYVTKPFSVRELVARVHAVLRRVERGASPRDLLTAADVEIDLPARRVSRDGREVRLTPTEFELLWHLAEHPGVVFSRARLLTEVWGYPDGMGTRTVDSHVAALRRKLGPDLIRTARGVGYALEAGT
jgi:DNA-binding response OmpR family regulator